jgi:DNA-binding MarR family transcriptional regulator
MNTPLETITPHDALILQQISEDGEDDVMSLASELHEPRGKVLARLNALRSKGLITVVDNYNGIWVRLSRKGKRMVSYLWPETHFAL